MSRLRSPFRWVIFTEADDIFSDTARGESPAHVVADFPYF